MEEPASHRSFFPGSVKRRLIAQGSAPGVDEDILGDVLRQLDAPHHSPHEATQRVLAGGEQRGELGAAVRVRLWRLGHTRRWLPSGRRLLHSVYDQSRKTVLQNFPFYAEASNAFGSCFSGESFT